MFTLRPIHLKVICRIDISIHELAHEVIVGAVEIFPDDFTVVIGFPFYAEGSRLHIACSIVLYQWLRV